MVGSRQLIVFAFMLLLRLLLTSFCGGLLNSDVAWLCSSIQVAGRGMLCRLPCIAIRVALFEFDKYMKNATDFFITPIPAFRLVPFPKLRA